MVLSTCLEATARLVILIVLDSVMTSIYIRSIGNPTESSSMLTINSMLLTLHNQLDRANGSSTIIQCSYLSTLQLEGF
jgi:hypothetical protein